MDKVVKCLVLAMFLIAFGVFIGWNIKITPEPTERVIHDTTEIKVPVPYKVDTLKTDTVFRYKIKYIKGKDKTDTIRETDTIYLDRVSKHYVDSMYECWISGIDPNLDSINVFQNTIYITQGIPTQSKWTIGYSASVGVQYGLINQQWDVGPTLGMSVAYNF